MGRWLLLLSLVLLPSVVWAQSPLPNKIPSPPNPTADERQDGPSLPDEMRTRMAIERAKSEHKKLLDSAKELGTLSSDLEKTYNQTRKLTSDEYKKLSSIEKLAKKILSDCGGSEVGQKSDADERPSLREAISRLKTVAVGVEKKVEAETRFVVSASVIADSNEVIHLAQYIRRQR
jgi:hypothetical protein